MVRPRSELRLSGMCGQCREGSPGRSTKHAVTSGVSTNKRTVLLGCPKSKTAPQDTLESEQQKMQSLFGCQNYAAALCFVCGWNVLISRLAGNQLVFSVSTWNVGMHAAMPWLTVSRPFPYICNTVHSCRPTDMARELCLSLCRQHSANA